ncbi:hypothetical protein H5410_002469 [Solanum commersonii]|uniref:Uncharacterized protein n=1 Tax=Solanum commersonii TaxID=4109 RepID=A0A9J6B262_SOLCO|nr:hypothetical protein H5410_002469 [Solanum commersonii]
MVEESTVSEPILEHKPYEKVFSDKGQRNGSRTMEESTVSEPILVKNILRKGYKDGGRVHGKGSRAVEESMVSEPILEPKPRERYSKARV